MRVHGHNVNSLSVLGIAEFVRGNNFFLDVIFQDIVKAAVDFTPGVAFIVSFQIGHVLKNDISWAVISHNIADILKEVAALFFIMEALLFASLAEGLARESGAQNVVCRNIFRANGSDIALDVTAGEIDCVQSPQVCFKLAGKDTVVSESVQSKMEATYAGEQVNIA